MKISLIQQEHKKGCAVACLAMVTGKTYSEVAASFARDLDKKGLFPSETINYAADAGFDVIQKKVELYSHKDFGRAELLKPFAPVHILCGRQFFDSESTHVVVMDEKGKIFCPSGASEEKILSFYRFDHVIGLYKAV